jgi:DNA-binding NtrC family response regulator
MLVEDEPMVGDFMAELLRGWGLEVVLERDPVAAAAWLDDAAQRLDILITDQSMPRMTGLALAQHVVLQRPDLPVLLYTGDADLADATELAHQGVREVMRKPIDLAALRTLLLRWLDERRTVAVD